MLNDAGGCSDGRDAFATTLGFLVGFCGVEVALDFVFLRATGWCELDVCETMSGYSDDWIRWGYFFFIFFAVVSDAAAKDEKFPPFFACYC